MAKVFLLFFLNQLSFIQSDFHNSYKYWYVDLEGFCGYRVSDQISAGILGGISLYLDPISTFEITSKTYLAGMYCSSEIYDNYLISNIWIQLNYGYNKYYNHFNFLVLMKPAFCDLPFTFGISINNNYSKNEAFLSKKPSVNLVLCADIVKNTRKFNFGAKIYASVLGNRSLSRSYYYNVHDTLKNNYASLEKIALDSNDFRQDSAKEMIIYLDHAKNIFISKKVVLSLKNREFLDHLCGSEIQKKAVLSIKKPEVLSVELAQYRSKVPSEQNILGQDTILGKNIMMLQDYLWVNGVSRSSDSIFDFEDKNRFIDIYSGFLNTIPFVDSSRADHNKDLFGIFNYIQSSLRLLKDNVFINRVRSKYFSIIANKIKCEDIKSKCNWSESSLSSYIEMKKTSEEIKTKSVNKDFRYLLTIYNDFPKLEKFIRERKSRIDELIKMIDDMYDSNNIDDSLLLNKSLPDIVSGFDEIFGELSEKEYNIMKKIDTILYEQESYFSKIKDYLSSRYCFWI